MINGHVKRWEPRQLSAESLARREKDEAEAKEKWMKVLGVKDEKDKD